MTALNSESCIVSWQRVSPLLQMDSLATTSTRGAATEWISLLSTLQRSLHFVRSTRGPLQPLSQHVTRQWQRETSSKFRCPLSVACLAC